MKTIKEIWIVIAIMICSCSSKNEDAIELIDGEGIFTTVVDGASIEGELFLPDGDGPFPTIIIVPGSGNDTRESVVPFADIFNQFGYGLYVYDKRGLGGSTGSYPMETLENPVPFLTARARDIISIVELLQNHVQVNNEKIGLFGSSQGTWVNTITYDLIGGEIGLMLMASGGATSTGAEQHYEDLIENFNLSIEEANQEMFNYDGAVGYDPKPSLESITIPTLLIYGGKDDSHPTLYDKEIVEGMQKSNFSIHFYSNADHSLLDVDSGEFPDDLFQNLGSWLSLHK